MARPCSPASAVRRARLWGVVATAAVAVTLGPAAPAQAAPTLFGPGALIIPMDTAANGQDAGMLRAYGLVYELLRNRVPVSWAINPSKLAGGDDLTVATVGGLRNVESGALIATPRAYRGGPFIVAATDRTRALPIVQSWLASDAVTVVHELVGAATIFPDIARTLVAAPRIAVLKDGNEQIAFNDLNAAGVRDSAQATWGAASVDLLTEAAVAGPTTAAHDDGALFDEQGAPRYCQVLSMHYTATSSTAEVVAETRSWLEGDALGHLWTQCESTEVFEDAAAGHLLTATGLDDVGTAPATLAQRAPANPSAQLDNTIQADSGAVDRMQATTTYATGVTTLLNDSASPLTDSIVLLTGRVDGSGANGRVTELAGHDYTVDTPISSNPQTNGVRLLLNALLAGDCAVTAPAADLALTVEAPAQTTGAITYTLAYSNPGPQAADNVVITETLPPGTTFASATPGAVHSAGTVTWNLGTVPANASGSVTVTVAEPPQGTYVNAADIRGSARAVRRVVAAPVSTQVLAQRRLTAPGTLDLGERTVGTIGAAKELVITNPDGVQPPGGATAVNHLALSGDEYVIATDGCSGRSLAPGQSCTVRLRFAPSGTGTRAETLTVTSDRDAGPLAVALIGTGTAAPAAPPTPGPTATATPAPSPTPTPAAGPAFTGLRLTSLTGARGVRAALTVRPVGVGGRLSVRLLSGRTTVGSAKRTPKRAGALRLDVRLTARGRALLRTRGRLRLTARVALAPRTGATTSVSRTITVRRPRR